MAFYPAQSSLIPVQIALARFLENKGWSAAFADYPYWYLGTTPYKYLTGPILPGLLTTLHKLLPQFNLFELFFFLLILAMPLAGWAVFLLLKELGAKKNTAILSSILFLFGPIMPLLFSYSDGLYLISFAFLPLLLCFYARFLKEPSRKLKIYCILLIAFLMLLNIMIVPTMLLGMTVVFLTLTGWKKSERKIKATLSLLFYAMVIATVWYSPGYWWQLVIAPSFAGKSLYKVVAQLGQLLPAALALTLAFVSKSFLKQKEKASGFGFYWLFVFLFLTLVRFIADPDFILDWTAYGYEVQLGLVILLVSYLTREQKLKFNYVVLSVLITFCLVWLRLAKTQIYDKLQSDINQSYEYQLGQKLSQFVSQDERVLLSGSSVFWLNAFFDISQVRGGADRSSTHPSWRQAVWEIREGESPEKSIKWLEELNVTWLVVSTQDSKDYYHDFKYPDKFEAIKELKKVYDSAGDRIYKVY